MDQTRKITQVEDNTKRNSKLEKLSSFYGERNGQKQNELQSITVQLFICILAEKNGFHQRALYAGQTVFRRTFLRKQCGDNTKKIKF